MPLNKEGDKVSMQEAFDAWQPHAVALLIETAKRYNGFVTYSQLAEFVQAQTGITHRGLVMNWIGDVLGRVISVCTSNGWPQLTSLCVTSDGTGGAGYKFAVLAAAGTDSSKEHAGDPQSLDDLDEHAARMRLECYRFFGADLPPDGGKPTLTPKAHAKKEYKKAQAKLDAPLNFCSKCNEALPMTGQCDNCD